MSFGALSQGSFDVVGPRRVKSARSNSINPGQTWSTLVKLGQPWSNFLKLWQMCSGPRLEVILMWWALIGSGQLGPGYLVLRADTQENPEGKNGVMTNMHLLLIFSTFLTDIPYGLVILLLDHKSCLLQITTEQLTMTFLYDLILTN